MKVRLLAIFIILVLCAAAYVTVSTSNMPNSPFISPVYAQAEVEARESMVGGNRVGDVLVNGQVVFRIRTPAGGLSPYERALIVADRLEQTMGNSLQPEDITIGRRNGQDVVLAGNQVVITADSRHAAINRSSPLGLANLWANRLENAVVGRSVAETPTNQKVVPIISVGSGTRVGGALVTGASDRLREVNAVAQVEGRFGNAVRVRALIPVSTEDVVRDISRVPETSVIGLVDIDL